MTQPWPKSEQAETKLFQQFQRVLASHELSGAVYAFIGLSQRDSQWSQLTEYLVPTGNTSHAPFALIIVG